MPQPLAVDKIGDKAIALFEDVQAKLLLEQNTILNLPVADQLRLTVRSERLRDMLATIEQHLQGLREDLAGWLNSELPDAYQLGVTGTTKALAAVGIPVSSWAQIHQAAVAIIAQDTYDDILRITEFVADDTKRWIADIAERKVAESIIEGVTVKQSARTIVREAAESAVEFELTAVDKIGVRYKNGALHTLSEYGEMLMRTKTGTAFNAGTVNQAVLNGVNWFEGFDGADCGLTSHNDGDPVNGTIRDAETAAAYPLSHPRCRRSWGPRPDITDPAKPVELSTTEAQRADQRAFEADLRTRSIERSKRRAKAARRQSRATGARADRPARLSRR